VYAASKRATEDVVAVYSHLYSIQATGTTGSFTEDGKACPCYNCTACCICNPAVCWSKTYSLRLQRHARQQSSMAFCMDDAVIGH
jgi:hypothetical protein